MVYNLYLNTSQFGPATLPVLNSLSCVSDLRKERRYQDLKRRKPPPGGKTRRVQERPKDLNEQNAGKGSTGGEFEGAGDSVQPEPKGRGRNMTEGVMNSFGFLQHHGAFMTGFNSLIQ